MSDNLKYWLTNSVHQFTEDGPPNEVFQEYEQLQQQLATARALLREACESYESSNETFGDYGGKAFLSGVWYDKAKEVCE